MLSQSESQNTTETENKKVSKNEKELYYVNKFNEGKNCDWFAIIKSEKPKNHEYVDVKTKEEVQDVKNLNPNHHRNLLIHYINY